MPEVTSLTTDLFEDDELENFLGEGFHTAFRKAVDSKEADRIWHAINDLPSEEWSAVLYFVAEPLLEIIQERVAGSLKDVRASERNRIISDLRKKFGVTNRAADWLSRNSEI